MARLVSVNVGKPKNASWQGRTVYTGVWKSPADGPQMVRRLNIDGDGQGDLNGHGGEQRAVLVYQIQSYEYWQRYLGRDDFEYGQFGENFTVDGLADDEVCVGDRYRIGEAEFEVTQPRVTCFRVGMRMGEPTMPSLLVAHHRPGFYLRVVTEGRVQAGDEIVRTRIGPHAMSVADIDALLYLPGRDLPRLRAAVDIPALSPGWQQSFHELLDAAEDEHAAVRAATEPAWNGFRRMRVVKLVPESATVVSVYLSAADGGPLPAHLAGQFLTLRLPEAGDPAPVRSYSMSSAPDDNVYRVSVKREPQGLVSAYVHATLRAGSLIDVAAPRGEFTLVDGSNPVLLISAGIGATPVLAMLHQLAAQHSDRPIWWIHTARDAAQHPFARESQRLLQSLPHAHRCVFYTAAPANDASADVTRGRLDREAIGSLGLPADASAYLCGPAEFMAQTREALLDLGVAPARIRIELFGTLPPINPGVIDARHSAPHQPPGRPGEGPRITFARSGLTVSWSDDYLSLLELADACDVPTRWSCRTGVCHTCVTPVLSGSVEYAPSPLELPAADEVLICCSHPRADTVLDL